MSSRFPASTLDGLRKVSGDGRGAGPSFFAMAFSDEGGNGWVNSWGTQACPEARAGEGQAGPGGVRPRCRRGGCCGHPGRGWSRTAAGWFLTDICRFTTHDQKNFRSRILLLILGFWSNPQAPGIRVMAHKPGCNFCIRRECFRSR